MLDGRVFSEISLSTSMVSRAMSQQPQPTRLTAIRVNLEVGLLTKKSFSNLTRVDVSIAPC